MRHEVKAIIFKNIKFDNSTKPVNLKECKIILIFLTFLFSLVYFNYENITVLMTNAYVSGRIS